MFLIHIWSNHEPYQSIEYIVLSKELAQHLVEFSNEKCSLLSEISWIDYELISDLDTLIMEFNFFHQNNCNFYDEILSIIQLIHKAKDMKNNILFDPFDNEPY